MKRSGQKCQLCNTTEHNLSHCDYKYDVRKLCSRIAELPADSKECEAIKVQLRQALANTEEIKQEVSKAPTSKRSQQNRATASQEQPLYLSSKPQPPALLTFFQMHIGLLLAAIGAFVCMAAAQFGARQTFSILAWPCFFAVLIGCNVMASQARDQTLGRASGMEAGLPKLD